MCGCLCPVVENAYGVWRIGPEGAWVGPVFVVATNCFMHGQAKWALGMWTVSGEGVLGLVYGKVTS